MRDRDGYRIPTGFLAGVGGLLSLAGLGGIGAALLAPGQLKAAVPGVVLDASAVGGATSALGGALLVLGVAQLVTAAALRREVRWAPAAGVMLGSAVGILLLASATACVVMIAAGAESAPLLAVAGLALGALALAYAGATAQLVVAARRRLDNIPGRGR
ncbi:MAG: hypothetical protein DLM71_08085 [Chloroflexi bacterium]|nr:MAG: hypothetical protein DLM71_08085 [Chloroflexota bacterium]